MSLLGGMTMDDINNPGIYFDKGEIVKFLCTSANLSRDGRTIILGCKVLSGSYVGNLHDIFMSNRDHPVAKKLFSQFLKTFWTDDELERTIKEGADLNISKLVGKEFTAKSGEVREHEGKKFQGFAQFAVNASAPTQAPNTGASAAAEI